MRTIRRQRSRLDRLWAYSKDLRSLRRDDVLLVSFPKSGSTWLRFILCHLVIEPSRLDGASPLDFAELNRLMPEIGQPGPRTPWPSKRFPRVVKTHMRRNPFLLGRQAVLLVRDPRDTIVSYYHHEMGKRRSPAMRMSLSDFVRHPSWGARAWYRHFRSWKNRALAVLRYEELRRSPTTVVATLLDLLGTPAPSPQELERAVELSSFERIRRLEDADGRCHDDRFSPEFRFARCGREGQYDDWLDQDDLRVFERLEAACPSPYPAPNDGRLRPRGERR